MPLSSIALVGASAALASVVFKDKDSRIKEVIDFVKISKEDIKSSALFKIAENDINSYVTGVKDNQFHEALLDIMARENKPVGYFCKLDGRLDFNGSYYLSIKKLSFFQSVFSSFIRREGSMSHFSQLLCFLLGVWTAIFFEQKPGFFDQAISLALYALAGFMLYNWFTVIALIWKQRLSKSDIKEYSLLFEKYAKEKRNKAVHIKADK